MYDNIVIRVDTIRWLICEHIIRRFDHFAQTFGLKPFYSEYAIHC